MTEHITINLDDFNAPAFETDDKPWPKCPTCHRYIGRRQCRYCGKWYKTRRGLKAHESVCYRNPNRQCKLCGGTGKVTSFADGAGEAECPDCATAKRRQAGLDDGEDEL